jgi:hypothetical protein
MHDDDDELMYRQMRHGQSIVIKCRSCNSGNLRQFKCLHICKCSEISCSVDFFYSVIFSLFYYNSCNHHFGRYNKNHLAHSFHYGVF